MRLIDADALKTRLELDKQIREGSFYAGVMNYIIDSTPTVDAVPVVRCKDCIYYELPEDEGMHGLCLNTGAGYIPDGFCSDGERKDT